MLNQYGRGSKMNNGIIDAKNVAGEPKKFNKNLPGDIQLSGALYRQTLLNIGDILEGKESLDFVGSNGIYSLLFNMTLRNKRVLVKLY